MNCLATVAIFCVFLNFAFGSNEDYTNDSPVLNKKQYQYEINTGSKTDLLENKHYYFQNYYSNLGRRFVPVYPYTEKLKEHNDDDSDVLASLKELVKAAQSKKVSKEEAKLIPVKAPAELVLAIAKKSAKLKEPSPSSPTEEVIRNYVLRNGDYWNAVWKEDVDPSKPLRTGIANKPALNSVKAKVMPGSKLYDLVLSLQKMSPRLLYIINENNKNK